MPSTAASSGSSVSSRRRSPRSLPYDVEFSLTRNSSRTPCAASHRASASTSAGRRQTNEPRKLGIAQNEQRRSQPLASLSGAIGPPSSRRRTARGPDAGASTDVGRWRDRVPRHRERVRRRSTGEIGSSRRRSCGVCGVVRLTGDDRAEPGGDVGVVVEAEHRVGLGQRRRRAPCRTARPGSRPRRRPAVRPVVLEVGGLEQRVDGVLLGRLDEAAGVDHHGVGVRRVVDEQEPVGLEPAGELLGVDLVAGAPEGHAAPRTVVRWSRGGFESSWSLPSMTTARQHGRS